MHQLENGYTRIANSLVEYFYKTPLSGAGLRIIFWVLRNSYGYQRKRTRPISIRKLAEDLNMEGIGAVHLAVQVLLENGILIKSENGEYELNKNQLIVSVPKTEHLKVFPKLNASVPKTERSVPKTEHPLIIKKENSKENLKIQVADNFTIFYTAYPKHKARGGAYKAWCKLTPPLDVCLKTLEWQKNDPDWIKEKGKYIPLPATWLNDERWLDDAPPAQYIHPSWQEAEKKQAMVDLENKQITDKMIKEGKDKYNSIIAKQGLKI